VINHKVIDTAEYISGMGNSSENLVGYVTSSSLPNIPLIFTMKKTDGSLVLSF
jgi:hypothetical protein